MDGWKILAVGFFIIILILSAIIIVMIQGEAEMCERFCEKLGGEMKSYRHGRCVCTDVAPPMPFTVVRGLPELS